MFDNGINNEFEGAHQKGLSRGFDLGWTYKGKFDRQIIQDEILKLEKKIEEANTERQRVNCKLQVFALKQVVKKMKQHSCNREGITFNSW